MILPRIETLCEWFKPELIDVLLSNLLVADKEDKKQLELSRMKAEVLFHLII